MQCIVRNLIICSINLHDSYAVLFTNPRGSTGYGSYFANVIDNNYQVRETYPTY